MTAFGLVRTSPWSFRFSSAVRNPCADRAIGARAERDRRLSNRRRRRDASPVSGRVELAEFLRDAPDRVLLVEQANTGAAGARNKGLDSLPEGTRFVAFLDSDDEWLPGSPRQRPVRAEGGVDFYFADFHQLRAKRERVRTGEAHRRHAASVARRRHDDPRVPRRHGQPDHCRQYPRHVGHRIRLPQDARPALSTGIPPYGRGDTCSGLDTCVAQRSDRLR